MEWKAELSRHTLSELLDPEFRAGVAMFFDLAGTLVERDAPFSPDCKAIIRRLTERIGQFVLVTGQPSDDPQVQEVFSTFGEHVDANVVIYTTSGGARFAQSRGRFEKDLCYEASTALEEQLFRQVEILVAESLTATALAPLIPVTRLDQVAVRINLDPSERARFVDRLRWALNSTCPTQLDAVIEGRTSVYVMRRGINKKHAVEHELEVASAAHGVQASYYFGDEVDRGNDRQLLDVPNLSVVALCSKRDASNLPAYVEVLGRRPQDLYKFLRVLVGTAE